MDKNEMRALGRGSFVRWGTGAAKGTEGVVTERCWGWLWVRWSNGSVYRYSLEQGDQFMRADAYGFGLDVIPRYAPSHVRMPAGTGLVDQPVREYRIHFPGEHPDRCPIMSHLIALECVTEGGSCWFGCLLAWKDPDGRMIVGGADPRESARLTWPIAREPDVVGGNVPPPTQAPHITVRAGEYAGAPLWAISRECGGIGHRIWVFFAHEAVEAIEFARTIGRIGYMPAYAVNDHGYYGRL
jgi:hypothetical protein